MHGEAEYSKEIVNSAAIIRQLIAGRTHEQFVDDLAVSEAVQRRLGIIGEAASRIGKPTRQKIVGPPWELMVKMRNVLIHVYWGVDLRVVWDTAVNDLPALVVAVQQYRAEALSPEPPPSNE